VAELELKVNLGNLNYSLKAWPTGTLGSDAAGGVVPRHTVALKLHVAASARPTVAAAGSGALHVAAGIAAAAATGIRMVVQRLNPIARSADVRETTASQLLTP
jgi:hypothetical protein